MLLIFKTKSLLVLLVVLGSSATAESTAVKDAEDQTQPSRLTNASCPTWQYRNPESGKCVCGVVYANSVVLCSTRDKHQQVAVLHGYCITHAVLDNLSLIVGTCPYNIMKHHAKWNSFYHYLPSDPGQIDSAMCGNCNRMGQLCGDCDSGHSPPVFSYYPQCVNCSEGTSNWGKFLVISLVPQTAFFLSVLALRLRATSQH